MYTCQRTINCIYSTGNSHNWFYGFIHMNVNGEIYLSKFCPLWLFLVFFVHTFDTIYYTWNVNYLTVANSEYIMIYCN